ncbi:MAG TPA: c-type cytochrome [Gaiellaceae bacterium]|nr:c-type cytochrome [Gaiellaceae bacterium]
MRPIVALLAAALVLALPASAANVQHGKQLFGEYCVSCHGPNAEGSLGQRYGGGKGRDNQILTGLAPSLHGVGALAADFYLTTGYMPLRRNGIQPRRSSLIFGRRDIADLTAYIASLGKGPAIPKPDPAKGNLAEGMHLFTDHCAGCHQVVAEGGFVTGAVPPPLEDDSSTQIAEAVRIGPYVMPKFTKKAISDAQLNSIIAYVQYAKHPDDRGGWSLGHIGPVPEGLVAWFIAAAALVAVCMVIGKRLRG